MKKTALKTQVVVAVCCGILAALAPVSATAQIASDNAGNYSGNWPSPGPNNGFGFGAWSFNNATPNGGFSGQFLGASGGINSGSGNAFGMYANGGAGASAQITRPFLQTLMANQSISLQMQNGNVTDNGGQVGFDLTDGSGNNIVQFSFLGGGSDYQLTLWQNATTSVSVDTHVGYNSGPLTLSFGQLSGDAWTFSLTTGSGTTTLTSASTGDLLWENDISQLEMFSTNGGASRTLGDNGNLFVNNLEVAPEPTTLSLLGGSLVAGLLWYRRRQK